MLPGFFSTEETRGHIYVFPPSGLVDYYFQRNSNQTTSFLAVATWPEQNIPSKLFFFSPMIQVKMVTDYMN